MRNQMISAYVAACFDNFIANRTSSAIDWTNDDEAAAKGEASSLSNDELRMELGLPIPDRFALVNRDRSDFTYDNAESYNRDTSTL